VLREIVCKLFFWIFLSISELFFFFTVEPDVFELDRAISRKNQEAPSTTSTRGDVHEGGEEKNNCDPNLLRLRRLFATSARLNYELGEIERRAEHEQKEKNIKEFTESERKKLRAIELIASGSIMFALKLIFFLFTHF